MDKFFGDFEKKRELRPDSTIEDLAPTLKEALGVDVAASTVVTSFKGESGIKRWMLVTPEKEWVLIQDYQQASFAELLQGAGPCTVLFASAPLFLLTVDQDFQLTMHADVYDTVREAMKQHGVKDGTPYISLSSISPTNAVMINSLMKKLSWDAVDVAMEPIGNVSGITFYNDPEGEWKITP